MKKFFLLLMLLSIYKVAAYAQTGSSVNDSGPATTVQMQPPSKKGELVKKSDTSLQVKTDTSECKCATLIPLADRGKDVNYWLAVLPFLLFLLFSGFIIYALRDFKLSAALAENSIGKVTIPNAQYDADKLSKMITAAGSANSTTIIANLATLFPTTIDVSNLHDDTVKAIENAIQAANVSKSTADYARNLKVISDCADAKATASAAKAQTSNNIADATPADATAATTAIQDKAQADTDRTAANTAKVASTKADADAATADDKAKAYANLLVSAIEDAKTKVSSTPGGSKGKNPLNHYFRPSSSRLIAFISSILTIIIALSMSSFYFYEYMYSGCPPDLAALSKVLLTLGLGLLPYGANKIAGAVNSNKSDPQS